jgi:hypothetical protein
VWRSDQVSSDAAKFEAIGHPLLCLTADIVVGSSDLVTYLTAQPYIQTSAIHIYALSRIAETFTISILFSRASQIKVWHKLSSKGQTES